MRRGRRSELLLGALALVALANGVLLGLSLYGLLAAALHVTHDHAPRLGYAWLAGILTGGVLLAVALRRARSLAESGHEVWCPFPPNHPILERFQALANADSSQSPPALYWVDSADRNAFVSGRSRRDASIVITAGLIEQLQAAELDAIIAQQLAHVEFEDLRAVGLADAIADSIGDLARTKSRFLWGPKAILADTRPFLLASVIAIVAVSILSRASNGSGGMVLLSAVASLALLYAMWVTAKRSWRGLVQLFLFISFFGPMSLVEAALAPPTAFLLSRLVSRARVHEADARAVELCGNRHGLISALEKLEAIERAPSSPWLAYRRFSLFVAAQAQGGGYRAWLAQIYATHPSIVSRIETIRGLD